MAEWGDGNPPSSGPTLLGGGLSEVAIDPSGGAGQNVYYKPANQVRPGEQGGYSYGSPSNTGQPAGGAASTGPFGGVYDNDIRYAMGADGQPHYYIFSRDYKNGGGTWTDGGSDINAFAAQYQIPVGVVQQVVAQQQAQNKNYAGAQYGQVLNYDQTTGQYEIEKPDGTRAMMSQEDALKVPGVTASDMQQSQATSIRMQGYINGANTWDVKSINRDGTVNIVNGNNTQKTVTAQEASGYSGITQASLQKAQYEANDTNFQMDAFNYGGAPAGSDSGGAPPNAQPGMPDLRNAGYNTMPQGTPGGLPDQSRGTGAMPGATPDGMPQGQPGGRYQAGGYGMSQDTAVPQSPLGQPGPAQYGYQGDMSGALQPPMGSAGGMQTQGGSSLTNPQATGGGASLSGGAQQQQGQPSEMGTATTGIQGGGGLKQAMAQQRMSMVQSAGSPQTMGSTSGSTSGSSWGSGGANPYSAYAPGAFTNPAGMTNQQASQQAQQAQTARTLAARGQYTNITGGDNGSYVGKNFLGQTVNLTAQQAIASGSASKEDLFRAQAQYGQDVGQAASFARMHQSRMLAGYDPNQLNARVIGM